MDKPLDFVGIDIAAATFTSAVGSLADALADRGAPGHLCQ